jgi:hypothetical protein
MNKKYVKPAMAIEAIETESMMIASSIVYGEKNYDKSLSVDSKGREEIWEEDTDLWGNDCWTRVE